MPQKLKAFIIIAADPKDTEWDLVDFITYNEISDEHEQKCSTVYWDKDLAQRDLEKLREETSEAHPDRKYKIIALWGEVTPPRTRSKSL